MADYRHCSIILCRRYIPSGEGELVILVTWRFARGGAERLECELGNRRKEGRKENAQGADSCRSSGAVVHSLE